jgi:hypothetical protein
MMNVNGKSNMIPTESETTRTVGNFSHGSRETPATSSSPMELDRSEKARCQHPDMHTAGESDSSIVPVEEKRCQEPFFDIWVEVLCFGWLWEEQSVRQLVV